MPSTDTGAVPHGDPTQEAVDTLIAELGLPAADEEREYLTTDFLTIRASSGMLYSDAIEELLR